MNPAESTLWAVKWAEEHGSEVFKHAMLVRRRSEWRPRGSALFADADNSGSLVATVDWDARRLTVAYTHASGRLSYSLTEPLPADLLR